MIKIFLNHGYAEFEKDNKRYKCFREYNGKTIIYSLVVVDVIHHLKNEKMIISASLTNINRCLAFEKIEVQIVEYQKRGKQNVHRKVQRKGHRQSV